MAFALSACGGSGGSSSNNDEAGNQEQQGGGEEQQGGGSGGEEGSDSSAMNFTCSAGMENQSNLFKDYVGTYGDIAPDPETPDYDHTVAVDFDTMTYSVDGGDPVGFNVFGGEIQLMDGATASLNDDGTLDFHFESKDNAITTLKAKWCLRMGDAILKYRDYVVNPYLTLFELKENELLELCN